MSVFSSSFGHIHLKVSLFLTPFWVKFTKYSDNKGFLSFDPFHGLLGIEWDMLVDFPSSFFVHEGGGVQDTHDAGIAKEGMVGVKVHGEAGRVVLLLHFLGKVLGW